MSVGSISGAWLVGGMNGVSVEIEEQAEAVVNTSRMMSSLGVDMRRSIS
jgi:hypothetical protein